MSILQKEHALTAKKGGGMKIPNTGDGKKKDQILSEAEQDNYLCIELFALSIRYYNCVISERA